MARDVLIRLKKLSTTGKVPAHAAVRFEPTVLRADADGYILDDYFDAVMVDGEATVTDLPETDLNWAYKVQVRGHGRGAGLKQVYATWYVHLPAGEGTVNFEDLPRIDPKTLTPVNDPDPAWVDAVTAVFTDSVGDAVPVKMVEEAEKTDSPFRTALNAAIGKVSGLVAGSAAGVAAGNTATLQAAVDALGPGGKLTIPTGAWNLAGKVNLPNPFTIEGEGPGTRLVQWTFPGPVFEARDGGATVRNLTGASGGFTAQQVQDAKVIEDGTYNTMKHALLLSWGDDSTLEDVWVEGLTVGGAFLAWDFTAGQYKQGYRASARRVHTDGVNFGVYYRSIRDLTFDQITGDYVLTIGMEPHLVYTAAPNEAPTLTNTVLYGGPCHAVGGQSSFAYQFKSLTGTIDGELKATDSAGVLHVMTSDNLTMRKVTSTGDTHTARLAGSVDIEGANNNKVRVDEVSVVMAGDGSPVRISDGAVDCSIGKITATANHTTDGDGLDFDVEVRGIRNRVENVTVRNTGTATAGASVGIWSGTGNAIVNPDVSGAKHGITIRASTGSQFLDYDLDKITGTTGKLNINAAATGLINRPKQSPLNQIGQDRVLLYENGSQPVGTAMTLGRAITGQAWTAGLGTWHASGTYVYSSTTAGNIRTTVDLGVADIDLEAGVRHDYRDGLVLRYVDVSNMVLVRLNDQTVEAYTHVAGTPSTPTTAPLNVQQGRRYLVRAVVFGDKVDVFVDGRWMLTHNLSAADMTATGTATKHGLIGQNTNTRWDSIVARKIT